MNKLFSMLMIVSFLAICCFGSESGKIPVTSNSKEAIRLYERGFQLEDRLKTDDAENAYNEAIGLDPAFALAYLRLGMLRDNYDGRKKYIAEAMKYLDKISEGEKLWILARNSFYGTGKGEDEYGFFEKLVKLYPNDEKANYFFGFVNIHHGKKDYEKTVLHYKKAIEINPEYVIPYNELAYAYMEIRDFKNAEATLQKYIKLLPESVNPYDSYAEMLMRDGRFPESIKMYDKVLRIDPKYPWAIMGKAADLDFLERGKEAREVLADLENVKLSDYEDRHKWRSKFGSYVHEGDLKSAVEVLREQNRQAAARKDSHQRFFSYLRMITILLELKDSKQALKEYENWSRFVKNDTENEGTRNRVTKLANYYKGYDAYLSGNSESAYKYLKEYESILGSPDDDAKNLKALLLIKENNFDGALEIMKTTDMENSYNQFRIGEIFSLKGDVTKSNEWFEKAANHNTRNVLEFALVRKKAKAKLSGNANSKKKMKKIMSN